MVRLKSEAIVAMPRKVNKSIALHLILTLVSVVTVLLSIISVTGYTYYKNRKLDDLNLELQLNADKLAQGIALAVWNFDNNQIQKIMESMMKDQSVYSVSVSTGEKNDILVRDNSWGVVKSDQVDIDGNNIISAKRTIYFQEERLGTLTLYVTKHFLKIDLSRTRNLLVISVLLFDVILILSLYALIWQSVLRPLKIIERFAVDVSSEDRSNTRSISKPLIGEFAELRFSLEKMVDLLESRLTDLKASNERFTKLITGFPLGLGLFRPDTGVIEFTNNKFQEEFGYDLTDIPTTDDWFEKAYPDSVYREEVKQLWARSVERAMCSNEIVEVNEYSITCKNGQVKNIEVGGVIAGDHVLAIFNDITERKHAEREVLQYQGQLEELVNKRTEELVAARDLAESANRSKSQFLANMSHELRTPLNSIIGFSKVMMGDVNLKVQFQKNTEIINRAGYHLLTLINDILELSKIEAGKQELANEEIDLLRLIQEVIEMLTPRAEQAGIYLVSELPELPYFVIIDESKIRQILINLVSNAIKFTASGSVAIILSAEIEDSHLLAKFSVKDTGIGISEEDHDRIFDPFEQVDSRGSKSGTGLGLAISSKYVQMMGGKLELMSRKGEGSTFYFTLKLKLSRKKELRNFNLNTKIVQLCPEYLDYNILVADDAYDMRQLLRECLENLGFNITEAENGIQAKNRILEDEPGVVLLDWRMPFLDGISLTKEIRERSDIKQPVIIMLSANAFEDDRQEALNAGVDDFMGKPIEIARLYEMIEKHANIQYTRIVERKTQSKMDRDEVSAKDLDSLSTEARLNFVAALTELSPSKIGAALSQIRSENESLAQRLESYVETYQYRRLWNIFGILDDSKEINNG